VAIPLLIMATAFLMGLPTIRGGFVGNDDRHLVLNHVLVNHPTLAHAAQLFRIVHRDLYQPIPLLSFSAEFVLVRALGLFDEGTEGGAWLFHLNNVFLHVINAVLVFFVIRRLSARPNSKETDPRALPWTAFLAAILFAVHPLQVEVVAWVNGRMMLLSALFALASACAFARWLTDGRMWTAGMTLICVALCMMSKVRAGVPIVLFIVAYCTLRSHLEISCEAEPGRRGFLIEARRAVAPLLSRRFLTVWLGACGITLFFIAVNVGATAGNTELFKLAAEHLRGPRLVRVILALGWYVQHFLWPVGLASWYPAPGDVSWSDGTTLRALVILAGTALLLGLLRRHRVVIALGTLWFLGTIIDTLPIVPARNLLAADRYMYLSIIGLVWISASLAASALETLSVQAWRSALLATGRVVLVGICVALLATCWHLAPSYATSVGKTERIAKLFPNQPHVWARAAWAHHQAGNAALKDGQPEAAVLHYHEALRLAEIELGQPLQNGKCEALQAIGATRLKLGEEEAGLAALRSAVELEPDGGEPRFRLASALEDLGKVEESLPLYEISYSLAPSHNPTILRLAKLYRRFHRPADARRLYEKALENNRYEVPAILGLSELDIESGTADGLHSAELGLRQLLTETAENAPARIMLGVVLHRFGRVKEALSEYERVVDASPCNVTALLNLAQIHDSQRRSQRAADLFRRAETCGFESVEQVKALQDFYIKRGQAGEAAAAWERFFSAKPEFEEARRRAAWCHALSGEFSSAKRLVLEEPSGTPLDPLILATEIYFALATENYGEGVIKLEDLCHRQGAEGQEARRLLLSGLEWFEERSGKVAWTFCYAAALLAAEGRKEAAGEFTRLCDENCDRAECRAFVINLQAKNGP